MAVAHAIPTPNALSIKFFLPSILSFNSLAMVRGTDTEEVLPYLCIVEGILEVSNFIFLAI